MIIICLSEADCAKSPPRGQFPFHDLSMINLTLVIPSVCILQVDVIVDGIPSSCRRKNCFFKFDSELTPTVLAITPTQGQGEIPVIIHGTGFSEDVGMVSVVIGTAPCHVTDNNSTTVMCVTSRHAAGSYLVTVLVEGIGQASGVVCFHYLLTLGSVSPNVGGISGGYEITLTGEGFMELLNVSPNDFYFSYEIAHLPWLRHGIGLPTFNSLGELNICPSYVEKLDHLLDQFTTDYPRKHNQNLEARTTRENFSSGETKASKCSTYEDDVSKNNEWTHAEHLCGIYSYDHLFSVKVGGSPCRVTQARIDHLTCTTYFASPGQSNVSVSMFSETAVLESAFMVAAENTPSIISIEPQFGAVRGGYNLSITGTGFNTSNVNISNQDLVVTIGDAPCKIEFADDFYVVCIVGAHAPGFLPVWVVTPAGVAVWEQALQQPSQIFEEVTERNMSINSSIFPIYEYRLSATVDTLVRGSVAGGAEVVIEGGVFLEGLTQVFIGGLAAEIVSLQSDTLVVLTPPSSKTEHTVLITQRRGK